MKLTLRIQTYLGPRTVTMQGLSKDEASAVACAVNGVEGWAAVAQADRPRVSLVAVAKKAKAAREREASRPVKMPENVTKLAAKRKG